MLSKSESEVNNKKEGCMKKYCGLITGKKQPANNFCPVNVKRVLKISYFELLTEIFLGWATGDLVNLIVMTPFL